MISNASPMIIFGKLDQLNLLYKLFGQIKISNAVYKEVVENGLKIKAPEAIIIKEQIQNNKIIVKKLSQEYQKKTKFLEKVYFSLDSGEAETIALALETKVKEVLIDERIARKIAKLQGLEPRGSLYVLFKAYKEKILNKKQIQILITQMTSSKYRLSAEVINKFWLMLETK